jgi:drug/metabolite transporter (DMT)-like permease
MIFYGETLSLTQTVGMLLTTGAVTGIILTRHRQSQKQSTAASQSFFSGLSDLGKIPGLAWALVAALCQALGIVIARQALQNVDSTLGTLCRILPAVLGLALYSLIREKGADIRPILANPKLARRLALAALVGSFLGLILMSVGAKYAKTGISLALSSTYPLWVIPLARIYLKEPGDPKSYAWTALATLGIVVMMA